MVASERWIDRWIASQIERQFLSEMYVYSVEEGKITNNGIIWYRGGGSGWRVACHSFIRPFTHSLTPGCVVDELDKTNQTKIEQNKGNERT